MIQHSRGPEGSRLTPPLQRLLDKILERIPLFTEEHRCPSDSHQGTEEHSFKLLNAEKGLTLIVNQLGPLDGNELRASIRLNFGDDYRFANTKSSTQSYLIPELLEMLPENAGRDASRAALPISHDNFVGLLENILNDPELPQVRLLRAVGAFESETSPKELQTRLLALHRSAIVATGGTPLF